MYGKHLIVIITLKMWEIYIFTVFTVLLLIRLRSYSQYRTIPLTMDFPEANRVLYIDHLRYSTVACNGCLFWLPRSENHPVMAAEDLIHSWDSLKTCEAMEKLILSY
jgi:hypothetical protein